MSWNKMAVATAAITCLVAAPLLAQARATRPSGSSSSSSTATRSSSGSSATATARSSSSGSSTSASRSSSASSSGASSSSSASASRSQRSLRSDWRHRPPRHHYPSYHNWYGNSGYWGWWGPNWYWYNWPSSYAYGPYRQVVVVSPDSYSSGGGYGAIDLDIQPEEAEVWVDGNYVGEADDFDGFPSYLWLEPGSHQIVLYAPARETLVREVNLQSGEMLGFDDVLVPGVSRAPTEFFTQRAAPQGELGTRQYAVDDEEIAEGDEEVNDEIAAGTGLLRLNVTPADAAVWLDGRPIGSAAELASLRGALEVAAGTHEVVAIRPGWGELRRRVEVADGDELTLELDLSDP